MTEAMPLTSHAMPIAPKSDEKRRAALSFVREAFAEARLDGLDIDCMAQAALFTAFLEMVTTLWRGGDRPPSPTIWPAASGMAKSQHRPHPPLARFPIRWKHLMDQNSRQFDRLNIVLSLQSVQLERNML